MTKLVPNDSPAPRCVVLPGEVGERGKWPWRWNAEGRRWSGRHMGEAIWARHGAEYVAVVGDAGEA